MTKKKTGKLRTQAEIDRDIEKELRAGSSIRKIMTKIHVQQSDVERVHCKIDPSYAAKLQEKRAAANRSEGSIDAKILEMFDDGKDPISVVKELKLPFDYVLQKWTSYTSIKQHYPPFIENRALELAAQYREIWQEDARQRQRKKDLASLTPVIVKDVREIMNPKKKTLGEEFGRNSAERARLDTLEDITRIERRLKEIEDGLA